MSRVRADCGEERDSIPGSLLVVPRPVDSERAARWDRDAKIFSISICRIWELEHLRFRRTV